MANSPKTKAERHEAYKARIRKICAGKTTLADFVAADIKKLTVILAMAYADDRHALEEDLTPDT